MVLKHLARIAVLAVLALSPAAFAFEIVEFHIAPGTGNGAWNSPETIVQAHVGDVLRIINDDSMMHQLHTNGIPCRHGTTMKARGGFYDCTIAMPYHREANGPLYEHNIGPSAPFFLIAE